MNSAVAREIAPCIWEVELHIQGRVERTHTFDRESALNWIRRVYPFYIPIAIYHCRSDSAIQIHNYS